MMKKTPPTRAIQKVTSGELLTKHAMRIFFYYTQKIHTYIHKLLLNVVTAGIEAPVILENRFLYAYVKDVCSLWAQSRFDTFQQLIIVEALRYQPVLQIGKKVTVAWSEIKAVGKVVKQLPAEMLQQC
jgi:hypothetical protein